MLIEPKGQLISKWFFLCLQFSQKTNENNSTWGTIVVKSNFLFFFWENWKYQKDILKLTDLYNIPIYIVPKLWKIPFRVHTNKISLVCSFVLIKITQFARSAINQKSADLICKEHKLIWCKFGDFNQDKTAD